MRIGALTPLQHFFVKPGTTESGPIIEFVDFGMVGNLNKNMKKSMKDLFLSFLLRDSHALVTALSRLGFIGEGANVMALERGLALMMEQYYGMTLGEARQMDIPEVADEISKLLYGQPFQIPAQFAFTGRAITTLVGVATGLEPKFNFVDMATPYARKFLGLDAGGIGEMLRTLPNQALDMGRLLIRLPKAVDQLITRLETGQLEVKLASDAPFNGNGHRRRGRRNGNSRNNGTDSNGLSWMLLFTISLAGGSLLMTYAHQMIPGWFFLGMAGLTGLRLIFRR